MVLEVRREEKDRQSTQVLIYRFNQRMRKSGILPLAKKNRFKAREKSKEIKKRIALKKEELRIKYGKLKKLGLDKR